MEKETLPGEERVQQYNLKWTNYVNNILLVFAEHFNKELLTDVTLSCEGKFIKAHKMVLAACSTYFQLFEAYSVPNPLIIFNNVRYNHLNQVIQFMYQGEIKVTEFDIDSLLALADNLQVKGLCNIKVKNTAEDRAKNIVERSSKVVDRSETVNVHENRNKRKRIRTSISVESDESFQSMPGDSSPKPTDYSQPPKLAPLSEPSPPPPLYNNASIHEQWEAFKRLNQKISALPDNTDAPKKPETIVTEPDICYSKVLTKVPRPPNAFMIFANEWRNKIATDFPGESNRTISVRLGALWKDLPRETKILYYDAAKQADMEHNVKYPGYAYCMKRSKYRNEICSKMQKQNVDPNIISALTTTKSLSIVDLPTNDDDCDDEVEFVENIKEEAIDVEQTCINSIATSPDISTKKT